MAFVPSEPEPLRSIEQVAAPPPSERIDTVHASAGASADDSSPREASTSGAAAGDIALRERNGAGFRGPASGASEGVPGEAPASGAAAGDIPPDNNEDNRVSRETRELPALVEYQIERDRAAAGAFELVAGDQPVPQRAAETERVHLNDHSEHSVPSTEGVWPVSEDLNLESSNPSSGTTGETVPAREERPVVHIAAAADGPGATRDDEPAPSRPAAVVLPLTRQSKTEGGGDGARRRLRPTCSGCCGLRRTAVRQPFTSSPTRLPWCASTVSSAPSRASLRSARASSSGCSRRCHRRAGKTTSPSAEWLIDLPEIGRVRCLTFRDHRGPGIIFRMVPARAIAADQLGLSAEVQALCSEADGVVLVTGGRDSGRSTLLTSFVDLINRTRADHIITVESQIDFVHESKRSFISQREVRGEDAMVGAVRSACREEPDVLVIEDIRSHEVAALALEAADAGRLVFASGARAFDFLSHRTVDRAVSRRASREGAGLARQQPPRGRLAGPAA